MKNKDWEYLKKYVKNKDINIAIKELESGMPVQYIVGDVNFYGNTIKVNPNVLIPRFETELLVEKTIKLINLIFKRQVSIIDLGTGSGAIAITLKKELNAKVMGVDISEEALKVARDNAEQNEVDIDFYIGDMLDSVDNKVDVIISNPPYIGYDEEIMDIVKKNEPHIALYAPDEGLYYYEKILRTCSKNLNDKFLIAFEIGYKQAKKIEELAYKYLDNIDVIIDKDYSGRDRFIFIKSKNIV